MRFSQRRGITPSRVEIQRDSVDEVLRNKLWSGLYITLFDLSDSELNSRGFDTDLVSKRLWIHFFHSPVDQMPGFERWSAFVQHVRNWFFRCEWYEVYDFIEALLVETEGSLRESITDLTNHFLETEMSAYRIVNDRVAEITSSEEISAIEDAIRDTEQFSPVRDHLKNAVTKLTDRKNPDYRNSIKESISAVEALCKRITKDPGATLGTAIKRLKDAGVQLHPAVETAWSKLYGYTSDKGGIRHALTDAATIGFAEAKYMLVSCSAFISYLIELSREAGIEWS